MWPRTLLLVVVLCLAGCSDRGGDPVHLIVPAGFEGVIQIVVDGTDSGGYRHVRWEPDWKNVKGTYVDLFGRNVGRAHGPAPEIYSLALNPELQQSYLAASSDEQVREFFRIMSSGTEEEKKAAVEAACDKALGEHAATRQGG